MDSPDAQAPLHTRLGGRRAATGFFVGLVLLAIAVALLGRLGQLGHVAHRLEHASAELLVLAAALEALSFAGYVVLTRLVFHAAAPRISWSESLDITLAGVVATRLVTAAGAGGIALTIWALRAAGLDARSAAVRLGGFLVVLYAVFFGALLADSVAGAVGVLHGVPRALALAGAIAAGVVVAAALATLLLPRDLRWRAPAVVRDAVALGLRTVRRRPSALTAAVAWWAFDAAVLWTTFAMFGKPPGVGVVLLGYLLGQLAQVIPLPGGIGPVEGGMIAVYAACGVPLALAIVAVLSYQAISRWLPVLPGAWGYVRLRRSVAGWRQDDEGR